MESVALERTKVGTVEAYVPVDYTREQVELIKDSFAKGATDAELALFVEIAKRKGLDIFSNQICLIGRWDGTLKRTVRKPQTTIDGYRLIAERTGRYVPGQKTTYEYDDEGHLMSATAYVKKLVGGEWHEISADAFWTEYVQTTREGKVTEMWARMQHVMLGKCAESQALRRAFPAELSGIYTQEEMSSANNSAEVVEEATTFSTEPTPHLTVTNSAAPLIVTKGVGNRWIVKDDGKSFTVTVTGDSISCSCGSRTTKKERNFCNHMAAMAAPVPAVEVSAPVVQVFDGANNPVEVVTPDPAHEENVKSQIEAATGVRVGGMTPISEIIKNLAPGDVIDEDADNRQMDDGDNAEGA